MRTIIKNLLFTLLLRFSLSKEEKDMLAQVYVSLMIKGRKTFAECPVTLKEQVRQILIDLDLEELIIE